MGIASAIVLILYLAGTPIEYTYQGTISDCLSKKRKIERLGWKDRRDTRFSCERRRVKADFNSNDEIEVFELLD